MRPRWSFTVRPNGAIEDVVVLDGDGQPHTVRKESAASKLAVKLQAQMRQLLVQMGSTPVSREKASVAPDGYKQKERLPDIPEPGTVGYLMQQNSQNKETPND
jgi:hypothetical protein